MGWPAIAARIEAELGEVIPATTLARTCGLASETSSEIGASEPVRNAG
jgi:hypothetical protein